MTVITPFDARSNVNPALVFSVTFRSPVTYVDIVPCVVTAPPTRTLTPPRTVLPQSALTCPALSPVDASTDQPELLMRPNEMVEDETGSSKERPKDPRA